MGTLRVVEYDPAWPRLFAEIAAHLRDIVGHRRIEHVGSTSVPGLPAKPIIDLDIVIDTAEDFPKVKAVLESAGYRHQGDLGIVGREMFANPENSSWGHFHLYVCCDGSLPLKNHLIFRDALRKNPTLAAEYAQLKQRLAEEHSSYLSAYTQNKTAFILKVLGQHGLTKPQLAEIDKQNRAIRQSRASVV